MGRSDAFLLGTDLVKSVPRLISAYDDAAGITAAFNKNVLAVINRELDADFDPETLHDWPKYAAALAERARQWELSRA